VAQQVVVLLHRESYRAKNSKQSQCTKTRYR
jgi:hypothetical protein